MTEAPVPVDQILTGIIHSEDTNNEPLSPKPIIIREVPRSSLRAPDNEFLQPFQALGLSYYVSSIARTRAVLGFGIGSDAQFPQTNLILNIIIDKQVPNEPRTVRVLNKLGNDEENLRDQTDGSEYNIDILYVNGGGRSFEEIASRMMQPPTQLQKDLLAWTTEIHPDSRPSGFVKFT